MSYPVTSRRARLRTLLVASLATLALCVALPAGASAFGPPFIGE